ncbi:hypothetical protein Q3G72_009014 [Acer saccharum]|nr:hypothetical protein Q3G72_009014 [Acer saccharum]
MVMVDDGDGCGMMMKMMRLWDDDEGEVIDGRVRWKVGTLITAKYHLYVTCDALIDFGNKQSGIVVVENPVKYQLVQSCSVSV